jgi:SET domain-containing protein
MAFNFNGVEVEVGDYSEDADAPASLGVGLYATACRLNHSCSPNCGWYASETGARIVRALMPVAEGEEDYHYKLYEPFAKKRSESYQLSRAADKC